MKIEGKVHCLFEQSGTFKNEFKKLGYEAYDYDIQNHFGETDFVIDLFAEINKAYEGGGKHLRHLHERRFAAGLLSVHLFLRTESDEFHMGMHKLSQHDGQTKDGRNLDEG